MVRSIFSNLASPYIIAEAGINHNGNVNIACDLVDVAKGNGANAIKFQTYKTEKRVGNISKKVTEILKKCELDAIQYFPIFQISMLVFGRFRVLEYQNVQRDFFESWS